MKTRTSTDMGGLAGVRDRFHNFSMGCRHGRHEEG